MHARRSALPAIPGVDARDPDGDDSVLATRSLTHARHFARPAEPLDPVAVGVVQALPFELPVAYARKVKNRHLVHAAKVALEREHEP